MNITGVNFVKMIQHKLESNPLQQGIIGIQLPGMASTDIINVVVNELFYNSDIQVVIIPPPLTTVFASGVDKDVKAIGGRVQRDRLDGIRYNRVYIALYWDDLGSLNSVHHDIFFQVEEAGSGAYRVSISDNRDFGGDSIKVINDKSSPDLLSDAVIESQMKETLSLDNVPFTYNSLPGHPPVRIPDDWFVEFPPNTEDNKLLAGGALKYIQDNLDIVTNVIKDAKDRINKTTIPMGVILDYTEYPIIRGAMRDTPKGPYVLIKIGMVNFGFSVQRAMTFDWYGLMVAELYLLTGE